MQKKIFLGHIFFSPAMPNVRVQNYPILLYYFWQLYSLKQLGYISVIFPNRGYVFPIIFHREGYVFHKFPIVQCMFLQNFSIAQGRVVKAAAAHPTQNFSEYPPPGTAYHILCDMSFLFFFSLVNFSDCKLIFND